MFTRKKHRSSSDALYRGGIHYGAFIIFYYKERIFGGIYGKGFLVKITEASKKYMPDSEPEPPYEGAKSMLPVTILDDRVALQAMVEEMYPELPERKPKKKKA